MRVRLTEGAALDLESICDFVAQEGSPRVAERILDAIEEALGQLGQFPNRGSCPRELADVGSSGFREVVVKPYRLIYRISDNEVVIYVVADGRRDMQALLARRLLRGG